jgi:16S rRNA (adenine1518-N6/adenine1519-N6)-dimethyltransferase
MKLSEMKEILASRNILLTKSLGQNFLHDGNQLRRIVEAADLRPSDRVLEIGPGLGPLTERLANGAGQVLAIEKDSRLVSVLKGRFAAARVDNVELVHADALDVLKQEPRDWSEWKMVSNLPYSVASPILIELAQASRGPERMVATLQLEVARRLLAGPEDSDYGLLTLLVQLDYEPRSSFKIPANCFFPPPDVDSTCVCLVRRARPLLTLEHRAAFVAIAKRSFSQRRKMMVKLLREDWPSANLEAAFGELGIPQAARAETVPLEKFVGLTWLLHG